MSEPIPGTRAQELEPTRAEQFRRIEAVASKKQARSSELKFLDGLFEYLSNDRWRVLTEKQLDTLSDIEDRVSQRVLGYPDLPPAPIIMSLLDELMSRHRKRLTPGEIRCLMELEIQSRERELQDSEREMVHSIHRRRVRPAGSDSSGA